jgi:hypothetical protein
MPHGDRHRGNFECHDVYVEGKNEHTLSGIYQPNKMACKRGVSKSFLSSLRGSQHLQSLAVRVSHEHTKMGRYTRKQQRTFITVIAKEQIGFRSL